MTTQPDELRHVGRVKIAKLMRRQQRGELPRCPQCSTIPGRIDVEGDPEQPILEFRPCGHRVVA